MKFLSVCVFYIYLRVAYSFYTGSTSTSSITTPSEEYGSPNVYSTLNSQNTYENKPDIDASKQNLDVQNGYYYPSTQESISGQPSSSSLEYRMGPGVPIPLQSPQAFSGFQQTAPLNSQAYTAGSSPHASTIQHLIRNPYIKDMYTKKLPPKRYTIIHPNGQIEHTDEINSVTTKYSDYVMVKAADILANVGRSNSYQTPPSQLPYTQPDPSSTNQNVGWTTTNSVERQYNQPTSNNLGLPVASNQNYEYQPYLNPNEAVINTAAVTQVTQEDPNSNKESINVDTTETILKDGSSNPSTIENLQDNVVAGNPLPIYPQNPEPNVPIKYEEPTETYAASEQVNLKTPGLQAVGSVPSSSNVTDSSDFVDTNVSSINQTTLKEATVTLHLPDDIDLHGPDDIDLHGPLPVILPEVSPQSTPDIKIAPTNAHQNEITSVTTIEESVTSNKDLENLSSSENTVTENEQPINTSETSTNRTNTVESIEKFPTIENTDSPKQNVSNQSLSTSGNPPKEWFQLSEEKIWNAIRNNTSNVYFLFLPPRPRVTKEIRTTIFPNGTSYKEIIETVAEFNQDGEPAVEENKATVLS